MTPRIPTTRIATVLASAAVVVAASVLTGQTAAIAVAHPASVRPIPAVTGHINAADLVSPLPTSTCVAELGIHCYSPLQFRTAYDLNPLYAKGITGRGRTIVIVDSFGSPTIQNDLQAFDAQWGLPDTTAVVSRSSM